MIWLGADPADPPDPVMDWSSATVFVLHDDGSLQWFGDQWQEGQPESDPALVAPAGAQQPVRGFGLIWRKDLGGPAAKIGWAI